MVHHKCSLNRPYIEHVFFPVLVSITTISPSSRRDSLPWLRLKHFSVLRFTMPLPILFLALLSLIGHLTYVYIIYPWRVSPLRKLPVPHWSCHFSSFWILRARKSGTENASLRDAHQRVGNIVRVASNTISVDGVDAMRIIYQGGFAKSPWYSVFDNYGYVARCLGCTQR